MKNLKNWCKAFLKDEQGTETLEWGLICGLVVVGAIAAMTVIGPKISQIWNATNTAVDGAASKIPTN